MVNESFKDKNGNEIKVAKRVSKTGQESRKRQRVILDAVQGPPKGVIVDDKPAGRNIAKDKQELRRYYDAYEEKYGEPPKEFKIERYNPLTGEHAGTETYNPEEFNIKRRQKI